MDLPPPTPRIISMSRVDAHVTIAGGMLWLLGGIGILIAVGAMTGAVEAAGLEAVLYGYGALAAIAVAVASFVAGFGLQRGLRWGWLAAVVVYCAWSMLVLPVAAYGLYALMRRQVRDAFAETNEMMAWPPPPQPQLAPPPPELAPQPRRRAAAQVMLMPAIAGLPAPAGQPRPAADDTKPEPPPAATRPAPRTTAPRTTKPRVRTNRRWPTWQLPRRTRRRAQVMLLQAVELETPSRRLPS